MYDLVSPGWPHSHPARVFPLWLDVVAAATERIDLELHIVGHGPLAEGLPGWVRDRGLADRVVHRGRIPWSEVRDLYFACDVLLFTSVRETFGSQLLEAAATGLPIVGLRLHGLVPLVPGEAAAATTAFTDLRSTTARLAGTNSPTSCPTPTGTAG